MINRALLFLSILIVSQAAIAKDIYVSPNGNGDGSEGNPTSLNNASSQAGAGDTVYLHGGTYSSMFTVNGSGSAGNMLTYKAVDGELPIFQGTGGDATGFGVSGTYVRVEGIVSRGFASGFANSWGGPNGNIEFKYCIADDHGRNGIAFYDAQNILVEGCIVSHVGHTQGWSSGVNMYGATGTSIIRRTISFENIDNSGNGTDGSGFIADEDSNGVVFENNIGFRNGGSCIRLTKSGSNKIVNNTCVHNGLDNNVQYHDEIFFSDAQSRTGSELLNNLCIPSSGQVGLKMGDGVPDTNNIWDGSDSLLASATGTLDYHLTGSASEAIDQGASGAPSDDIGFDWKCITKKSGQQFSWWEYAPDYDYIESIGGVKACFQAASRDGSPDIGAYEYNGEVIVEDDEEDTGSEDTGSEDTEQETEAQDTEVEDDTSGDDDGSCPGECSTDFTCEGGSIDFAITCPTQGEFCCVREGDEQDTEDDGDSSGDEDTGEDDNTDEGDSSDDDGDDDKDTEDDEVDEDDGDDGDDGDGDGDGNGDDEEDGDDDDDDGDDGDDDDGDGEEDGEEDGDDEKGDDDDNDDKESDEESDDEESDENEDEEDDDDDDDDAEDDDGSGAMTLQSSGCSAAGNRQATSPLMLLIELLF